MNMQESCKEKGQDMWGKPEGWHKEAAEPEPGFACHSSVEG
jgi:hypothetical protein